MFNSPYLLAIDLEATCDATQLPSATREIIEIGAVVIDGQTKAMVAEFQSFVRPVKTTILTEYCRNLTSIQQDDVDQAPLFPEVLARLNAFLAPYSALTFCAWGDYDYRQFRRDCTSHEQTFPFSAQVDVSRKFRRFKGLDKRPSLREAAAMMDVDFEGTHHRAIDDARCLASILLRFIPELEQDAASA